jgi:hypothetical protein
MYTYLYIKVDFLRSQAPPCASHTRIDCFTFLSINIITQDCRKQPIDKATLSNRDGWRQIFTRSILKFDKCAGKRKENWTTTESRDDANGNDCPAPYLCESHKRRRHTTQFMTLFKRFCLYRVHLC